MTRFIAHLRAGTRRQGAPGLGIEGAKRDAIARHGAAVTAELPEVGADGGTPAPS